MKRFLGLAVILLTALTACNRHDRYTVIVSLDGNRWDYPDRYETPFFDSLATVGVKAAMEPSFPASTFPNHYTMATGCVPDHNGIVHNSFRDPDDGSHYAMNDSSKRFNPKYYLKEPIWITAQRQGVVTGNIYWLGGDVAIQGRFPTYWRNWNEQPHWTFEERVDEAVRLMSLPKKERPRLLMVYFDEPDHTGHVSGPDSPETAAMVHRMDSLMHGFYLRLKALPHGKKINFILAGDHGVTEISPERFVSWAEALDDAWVEDVSGAIPTSIFCKEGYVDTVRGHGAQRPVPDSSPERIPPRRTAGFPELRDVRPPGRRHRVPGPGLAVQLRPVPEQGHPRLRPAGDRHAGRLPRRRARLQERLRGRSLPGRPPRRLQERRPVSDALQVAGHQARSRGRAS